MWFDNTRVRVLRRSAAAAMTFALVVSHSAFAADMFTSSTASGYARLIFALKPAGHLSAQLSGQILTITFDHKVSITPSEIAQALPGYIDSGHADADGKTFRFALSQAVRIHTSTSAGKSAVDLAPTSFSGTPPDLPQPPPPPPTAVDVSKLEVLKVRAGAYQNFTRIVFDWGRNVPYAVFPGSGKLTVRFEAQVNPDFSAITRQSPPWVKTAGWRIENKGTVIELETDTASGFHDFRDGTHVVVDVLAPKTDADAYNPPGDAKPPVTKLTPSTKNTNAVTTAQAQAIAATASKLNPQAAKPSAPVAKPPPPQTPAPDTGRARRSTHSRSRRHSAKQCSGRHRNCCATANHNTRYPSNGKQAPQGWCRSDFPRSRTPQRGRFYAWHDGLDCVGGRTTFGCRPPKGTVGPIPRLGRCLIQ